MTNYQPSEFLIDDPTPSNQNSSLLFNDSDICGEGGAAVVYCMRLGGARVAVKRLKPEFRENPLFPASYRKEYNLGMRLRHPGLPVYRDLHEEENEMYLVMDYIDGVTLNAFMGTEEGQRFFREKRNINSFLRQLLEVVTYLHRNGIVHCDLKPSNIMLRHSDRGVMLIDLDKAYSPTFDRTYGTTPHPDQSLSKEQTPRAHDDFVSLAHIPEYILERTGKKGNGTFKKFLAECRDPQATDETVEEALRHSSGISPAKWIAIGGTSLAVIIGFYLIFDFYLGTRHPAPVPIYDTPADTIVKTVNAAGNDSDKQSIATTPQKESETDNHTLPEASSSASPTPAASPASVPAKESEPSSLPQYDFDKEMSDFMSKLRAMEKRLESGKASIEEIFQMRTDIALLRTTKTQETYSRYKAQNPGKSESELYESYMKIANNSRSQKQFEQFYARINDTINKRFAQPLQYM